MEDVLESVSGINFDWCNPQSSSKLMKAVQSNDLSGVKKLLRQGKNPNITDNTGMTSIHYACRYNDCEILKLLLDHGGFVDHKTHSGFTALCIASYHGAIEAVKILLNSGASVNSKTNMEASPIHFACNSQSLEVVKCLKKAGADLEAKDFFEVTPLIVATKKGNSQICEYLLKQGVNMSTKDSDNRTAFHYSCANDNLNIFNLLLKYCKCGVSNIVNIQMEDGWSLLMEAAQFGAVKIIDKLLSLGVETSCIDSRGLLALHIAAHNSAPCFSLLLQNTPTETINKYCRFKPDSHDFNSLPCLLIDKLYFDSLKELLECPGVDTEVFTCPILKDNKLKSPICLLLSPSNNEHVEEIIRTVELYLKNNVSIEPKYTTDQVQSMSILNTLMHMHTSHPGNSNCYCARLFIFFLENGVEESLNTLDFNQNLVLHYFCKNGYIFGLSYFLRYSTLEPWDILPSFIDFLNKNNLFLESSGVSIEFLANLCTKPTLLKCQEILLQLQNKTSSEEKKEYLIHLFFQLSNIKKIPPLKSLSRIIIRQQLQQLSKTPHLFRGKLNQLSLPMELLNFLSYADLLPDIKDIKFPSFL